MALQTVFVKLVYGQLIFLYGINRLEMIHFEQAAQTHTNSSDFDNCNKLHNLLKCLIREVL